MRTSTWHRGARLGAATVALVLAGGLSACGDDDDEDEADTASQTTEAADEGSADDDYAGGDKEGEAIITATDDSLTSLAVAPGTEVEVYNEGEATHTVTADEGDAFDSGEIAGGEEGSFTAPAEPGDYPFHCEIHPNLTGTLTVEG